MLIEASDHISEDQSRQLALDVEQAASSSFELHQTTQNNWDQLGL